MRRLTAFLLIAIVACVAPLPAMAAEGGGGGWGWIETLGRWFNLLILFGAIAYFTREPISRFFRSRREEISNEVEAARVAKEEAQRKLAEVEERLKHLDEEIESIRAQAQAEAAAERERILGLAEQEAEKILSAAAREIDGLGKVARQELRTYAADLAVRLAETQVSRQLDSAAHDRINQGFLRKLGEVSTRRPS